MALTQRRFPGSEIKEFLRSEEGIFGDYIHRYFPDEDEIVFERLFNSEEYDLADRGFGYFEHEADKDLELSFLSLFRFWKFNSEALTKRDVRVSIPDPFDAWLDKQIGEDKAKVVSKISGFLPTLSQDKLNKILEIIEGDEKELNNFSLGK